MKTLNKYFVFSDVHGEFDALIKSLEDAGYDHKNPNHILISVGDAFDRGPKSRKIYDFFRQNKCIAIKGNHDVMFQEYMEKGMDGEFVLFNILHNGLANTVASFTGLNVDTGALHIKDLDKARQQIYDRQDIINWLRNMPLYYETENFVFVHAGIDPNLPEWKDTPEDYLLWDIEDSHKPCPNVNKLVVIGHHHAFRVRANGLATGYDDAKLDGYRIRLNGSDEGHITTVRTFGNTDEHKPYATMNKIAIDGCTNLTGKVNVITFEDYPLEETQKEQEPTPSDNITSIRGNGTIYATRGDIYMGPNEWTGTTGYTYTTTFRG